MNTCFVVPEVDAVAGVLSACAYTLESRGGQSGRLEDSQWLQMQAAFARTGGLPSGTDVAHRLRRHCDQPLSTLARWIVSRTIVSFEWHASVLVPMFQFRPDDMAPRTPVVAVMRELAGVLDDSEAALWFAQPNAWLDGEAPVDVILREPRRVIDAARADRFITRG